MPAQNLHNPFLVTSGVEEEGGSLNSGVEESGSLDKEFQNTISNPEAAKAILKANATPQGWYATSEDFPPSVFTRIQEDEDGTRTGVKGDRRMGVLLARCSQTYKGETYTSVIRIELSPDERAKRIWVDGAFDSFHPKKHDATTRMYAEAQAMYEAVLGSPATAIDALLEFLQNTGFKVQCMVRDDGSLTPYRLAPLGRARR